ncbi:hypothetical protein BT93_C1968 [Corymbia citriodora subsp. variegata]|nr:hypothetical protein BT93_C1968 [Corymbia citriodora subsp. variegata]
MATERYYAAIRAQADMQPKLGENDHKLLHMKEALGGWREWSVLTYDHNIIGKMLIKENNHLQKKIEDYEKKLRMLNAPPPYACWPTVQLRSAVNELDSAKSSEEPQEETE